MSNEKVKRKPGPKARLVGREQRNYTLDAVTYEAIERYSDEHLCSQSEAIRRLIALATKRPEPAGDHV